MHQRRNGSLGISVASAVIAFVCFGLAGLMWQGSLIVSGTVPPGDAMWEVFDCQDGGIHNDLSAFPDGTLLPVGWAQLADRVSHAATPYDVFATNKDAGSTSVTGLTTDTITVTLSNGYPGRFEECDWQFIYTGTSPVVVQSLALTPINFPQFATDIFALNGPLYVETNSAGLLGGRLANGDRINGELLMRLQQSAPQETTFTFRVEISLVEETTTQGGAQIECKWELPDMDSSLAGVQYDDLIGASDDDSIVKPDRDIGAPGTQEPCFGPPEYLPRMPDGIRHVIQVRPNPEDTPEQRRIQLWTAVDHPNGLAALTSVYWDVFYPDGTFATTVQATRFTDCNGPIGMYAAAIDTGQLSTSSVADANRGMRALCLSNANALFFGEFSLSKHHPCGEYKVTLHATGQGGGSVLSNYIDVICAFYLRIDFDGVEWGQILPGQTGQVLGDLDFGSPLCSANPTTTCPTIKNAGNSGMGVDVVLTDMVQCSANPFGTCPGSNVPLPGSARMVDFGACFGRSASTIQCLDPGTASLCSSAFGADADPNCHNESFSFDTNRERVLCSNEVGKLDLTIHPVPSLPAGLYQGSLTILGKPVPICPTDHGSLGASTP